MYTEEEIIEQLAVIQSNYHPQAVRFSSLLKGIKEGNNPCPSGVPCGDLSCQVCIFQAATFISHKEVLSKVLESPEIIMLQLLE